MVGFITNSGTKYYVNERTKTIVGGKFKKPQQYSFGSAVIGEKGIFHLVDGRVLTTSVIRGYL